jgi:hypothetical protein
MIPRRVLTVVAAGALLAPWFGGAVPDPAPVAAGQAGAATPTSHTGSVAGKITFSGKVPDSQKVQLSADPRCAAMHKHSLKRYPVKVKDGGLAEVFVYVKSGIGDAYPAPAEPVLLDQVGCMYHPSIVGIMVGQPLRIRNSDDTLHNIHPRPSVNKEFNIGQPRKGMETTRSFDKPELMIPTVCDVHPWMRAYISVLPHPFFAVSGEDGSYEIKGLPEGEYEIEGVHGLLKTVTGKVSVKAGKTSALTLDVSS